MTNQLSAETKKEIAELIADALMPLRSELDAYAQEQKSVMEAQHTLNIQIKDTREQINTLFGQYNTLTSSLTLLEDEVKKWKV